MDPREDLAREATCSILIVDDHSVIADAIAVALRSHGFGPVVAVESAALSLAAVLDEARSLQPDIVLLDVHLGPERVGLSFIEPLLAMGAKVLLFTASSDPTLLSAGLRAGAEAVIDKSMSFENVLGALRIVASGGSLLPEEERLALIDVWEGQTRAAHGRRRAFDALTEREAVVLRGLIEGRAPKQIARSEDISVSTVRGHIERIFQKLEVNSQREALALARAADWPSQSSC